MNKLGVLGLAAASIVLPGAGGCEKDRHDRVEKFQMQVLDEGSAPRFTMAYAIPAGTRQTVDMILDLDMSMSGGMTAEMSLPRMIMVNDLAITDVDARTGAMKMEMTTTDVRVEDREGSIPGAGSAMQAELDAMKGMRMTATLEPSGRTRNMKLDESSVSSAKVREQMKQTEQMVDQMTTLLPEVAVGKGARWKVQQTIRQQGMRVNMTATYDLVEVTERTAKVHATIAMEAPPQDIKQGGTTVKLETMTATGTADSALDFGKLIERVEADIAMTLKMKDAGPSVTLDMKMGMQMLPSGAAPKSGAAAH